MILNSGVQGDLSGKLGFEEFKQLWMDLRKWKAVFKDFDKNNSGTLSTYELRSAFHASGKSVSLYGKLCFVCICCVVKKWKSIFKGADKYCLL